MSKIIRNIIISGAIIGIFAVIEPNCFNLITTKAYAQEKPYLRGISVSGDNKINFSKDIYYYIIDVDKDEDIIFLKAKPNDSSDIIKINGKEIDKDDFFKEKITLNKGKNKVEIEVDDDEHKSTTLYTVYIYRGGKEAIYLNDININDSTIGFEKSTTSYNIELDEGTNIVNLETFPEEGNYNITVNDRELGKTNSIKLKFNGIGKYTINIKLKDADTQRIGSYTLNIYLGISVSPNVSDSINKILKPNQWLIVNGRWRYNDSIGKNLKNTWFYDKNYKSYFYFNARGNMQTGWLEDEDKYYYLNCHGEMQTGWIYNENKWYFLSSYGVMRTGWVSDNNQWYFLQNDGSMATGWIMNNDKWYYLRSDGTMKTGWIYYDKKWYYLNSDGAMETGWIKCEKDWYYSNFDGSMKSGEWLYSNRNWYYLNFYGNMRCGWLYKDDKYYYFNEDGTMRTDSKTIDGYTYEFNQDGSVNFGQV